MKVLNVTDANTKGALVQVINQAIDDNQWSNKESAHTLQTPLADVSRIRRSEATNFSLDRLLVFLARFGYKVTIIVSSKEIADIF